MNRHIELRLCPNCASLHICHVGADGQIYMGCPFVPLGHGFHLNGATAKENIKRLMLEARGN